VSGEGVQQAVYYIHGTGPGSVEANNDYIWVALPHQVKNRFERTGLAHYFELLLALQYQSHTLSYQVVAIGNNKLDGF